MKSLVWFRNDFRMDDNPALRAACSQSQEVHGVFIYSENQFKFHNHYSTSGARLIIFINFFVLNSLVTGPKILVAIGSSCLSRRTAAFLSNLIEVPSDL